MPDFVRYKIIICLHNHIVVENLLSFELFERLNSCLALHHALHLKEEALELGPDIKLAKIWF